MQDLGGGKAQHAFLKGEKSFPAVLSVHVCTRPKSTKISKKNSLILAADSFAATPGTAQSTIIRFALYYILYKRSNN